MPYSLIVLLECLFVVHIRLKASELDWGIKWAVNWMERELFVVTLVYGPCVEGCSANFWQELRNTRDWTVGPWLISGDFNVIRFFGERICLEIHIPQE